jgi:CheY-like chemotaxis protein
MSIAVPVASDRWSVPDDLPQRRRGRSVQQPGSRASGDDAAPTPLFRGRVLVVDDSPGLRETVADILTGDGYRVDVAEDGLVALEHLARSSFDVMILDLAMPRLDGIEMLKRLEAPYPAVVICSAFEYFTPAEVEEVAGPKIFRWLRKPVAPDELLAVANEAAEAGPGPWGAQ